MIPVNVLTGFLGSGKTTLLTSMLAHPEMARTAVIVNEFGAIGIDHDLIAVGSENFVQLANGCLCCRIRSDLIDTLLQLAMRFPSSAADRFDRVVIETSGLADPAPILHALMTDSEVRARFVLAEVVTTVDGVLGDANLERYIESARQVAVADRIVLTKIDHAQARVEQIERSVHAIRPDVPVIRSAHGQVAPSMLFAGRDSDQIEMPFLRLAQESDSFLRPGAATHTAGITSIALVREQPLHAATLPLFLAALAENIGADLVRIKGIVAIAEDAERPAVIHGVQHVYEAPEWLPAWPSGDKRTRIVCIGRRLQAEWIRTLLDLLDVEVGEAAERLASAALHQQE